MSREEKVAVVEAYLRGLAGKDISKIPFAANITFEGPRVGKLIGRNDVVGFLTSILPAVRSVQIKQHIVEGDFVATVFEMETIFGVDQVFDRVHVCDGELKEIHSFYYPQPGPLPREFLEPELRPSKVSCRNRAVPLIAPRRGGWGVVGPIASYANHGSTDEYYGCRCRGSRDKVVRLSPAKSNDRWRAKMPTQELDPNFHDLLRGRYVGTLGTENADGTIHLTAVWYLFEDGCLFIATSSKTKKARNVVARPKASLMVDARKPGMERGATAVGRVELISGGVSQEINRRLHSRYLSAAAMSDPHVGPVFESFDDVTIRLTPVSWIAWDMAVLDAQALGGRLGKTPGYMLPLD